MAFWPVMRGAAKLAPVAWQVGRQVDRQVRPHVLAYRSARDVDGWVGRWTADGATHWAVFADPSSPTPVKVFPPLDDAEMRILTAELDRSTLRHHTTLAEARVGETASRLGDTASRAAAVPARYVERWRHPPDDGDDEPGDDDAGGDGPGDAPVPAGRR